MFIPKEICNFARSLSPAFYEMSTGGGADYIVVSLSRSADLILADPEDCGSPGWNEHGDVMDDPLSVDACVMLELSPEDEPHAWNEGSLIIHSGTVTECLFFMYQAATTNCINSEPDY